MLPAGAREGSDGELRSLGEWARSSGAGAEQQAQGEPRHRDWSKGVGAAQATSVKGVMRTLP
jgi:hypothetical protein